MSVTMGLWLLIAVMVGLAVLSWIGGILLTHYHRWLYCHTYPELCKKM